MRRGDFGGLWANFFVILIVGGEGPFFGTFNRSGWLLYLLGLEDWVCTQQ